MPAARCRRPTSRVQKNVPLSVMSTTVRHAFGDMSSAGTGKFAAALFTRILGRPNPASTAASTATATWSGSRMSQRTGSTGAPMASIAAWPAMRCSSLRLAITMAAPSRANSVAMAFPRPVPPPVMRTVAPSKVPAGRALEPSAGGSGKGIVQLPV